MIKYLRIKYLLDIPKTIWFNLKVLPLNRALKLPFYINHRFKVDLPKNARECIRISDNCPMFGIRFVGGGSEDVIPHRYGLIKIDKNARLFFDGTAKFSAGSSLRVDGGTLIFGENFSANRNCNITCTNGVKFGNDVLLAYNIYVRDADGHKIIVDETEHSSSKKVEIGDHVWICADSVILKGSIIPNNSVIAYGSLINKKFDDENIIIGGTPGRILKTNASWKF